MKNILKNIFSSDKNIFRALLFGIIFPGIIAFTIPNSDNKLYWTKNKRLSFSDFLGIPDKQDALNEFTKNNTHTFGTITKSIDISYQTQKGKTVFTVYAGMDKKLSWIRNDGDTITLKHEQAHFDICEIYARKLRRDLKKVKSLSEAKELYNNASADEDAEQNNFDKENTFISGGLTLQWEEKIKMSLDSLELHNKPIVIIPVYK